MTNKEALRNIPTQMSGTSGDVISRRAAIDKLDPLFESLAIDKIKALPSVQPEIIHCKDCKHVYIDNNTWHCPFGLMGGENFYCGYGSLEKMERERDG